MRRTAATVDAFEVAFERLGAVELLVAEAADGDASWGLIVD